VPVLSAIVQEFSLVTILITNDDGINSEGLSVLAKALRELGEVFVVAPDRQRSAVGLSITIERPLRVESVDERTFSVDGMPADCVTLAVHRLMESPPDLIVSGINNGQNLGYDIYHSGTVGAALVGTMFGIPSIAVSIANKGFGVHKDVVRYDTAAQVALKLARIILERMQAGMPALPGGMSMSQTCLCRR
jgi:5'-nucleotidase